MGAQTPETDDDYIYWYVLYNSDNSYSYTSSSSPVTNFTSTSFSRSASFPVTTASGLPTKPSDLQEEDEEVDANQMPEEVEATVSPTEETETTESESNSTSESGDSGDSGGDSGGGDGGGD